jgi:hypothetical protein
MNHLVELLNDVDESFLPDASDEKVLRDDDHAVIPVIRNLASSLLITDNGDPDFESIDALYNEHGYFIFPGERDTACLRTKKGIIVFG